MSLDGPSFRLLFDQLPELGLGCQDLLLIRMFYIETFHPCVLYRYLGVLPVTSHFLSSQPAIINIIKVSLAELEYETSELLL